MKVWKRKEDSSNCCKIICVPGALTPAFFESSAAAYSQTSAAKPESLAIFLSTDRPVSSGDWIGAGTSSSAADFTKSTVAIPVDASVIGLVINVRDNVLAEGDTVTATVYTSRGGFAVPVNTGISATVTGPNPHGSQISQGGSASGFGIANVNQCDLLSVQIISSAGVGVLSAGVSATVFLMIP